MCFDAFIYAIAVAGSKVEHCVRNAVTSVHLCLLDAVVLHESLTKGVEAVAGHATAHERAPTLDGFVDLGDIASGEQEQHIPAARLQDLAQGKGAYRVFYAVQHDDSLLLFGIDRACDAEVFVDEFCQELALPTADGVEVNLNVDAAVFKGQSTFAATDDELNGGFSFFEGAHDVMQNSIQEHPRERGVLSVEELVGLCEEVGLSHGGEDLDLRVPEVLKVAVIEISLEGLEVIDAHGVFEMCCQLFSIIFFFEGKRAYDETSLNFSTFRITRITRIASAPMPPKIRYAFMVGSFFIH